MKMRLIPRRWMLAIAVLGLALVGLGCSLPDLCADAGPYGDPGAYGHARSRAPAAAARRGARRPTRWKRR